MLNVIKKIDKSYEESCGKSTRYIQRNINSPYQNEIWAKVNYALPNIKSMYYISTHGRIYNTFSNKLLKPSEKAHDGYLTATFLDINSKPRQFLVHRVMMMVFYPIENVEDMQVNHINSNRSDNFIWNLEWCTPSGNMFHMANYIRYLKNGGLQ